MADTRASIRLFLACVAMLGVILVFRTPPMAGFDEAYHWRRALQVADLHPFGRRLGPNDWGGRLDPREMAFETRADAAIAATQPLSVAGLHALSDQLAASPAPQGKSGRPVVSFPSTASFSPIAYLPSAAGILVARVLRLGPLEQMHAGRLANLAGYLGLVWCVVLILPVGRLAVLALLTMPTPLHLAASFSADPVCNALPALLVACCLRLRRVTVPPPGSILARRWPAWLFGLVVLVGLLKPICCVVSAMLLLVPVRLFAGAPARARRAAWTYRIAAIAVCAAVALGWNLAYPFVPGRYWHTGADPHAAVRVLLSAPMHGIRILAANAWNDSRFWWSDGWGRYGGGPGPYHFTTPERLAELFLMLLLLLTLAEASRPLPGPGTSPRAIGQARIMAMTAPPVLLLLVAVAYLAALLLAFRIGYGPPGSDFIDGVQGRYLLLPDLLCLLALAAAWPFRAVILGRLAPPLLLGCLLLDLLSVIIALGHYAAVWH
ncbi:DUF2142 domain-containing protein [Lichenicola sp.]|uniref:DUF2142 domain-containing protein n=1 Tax=Lichenicola sp. TaxID=2804529 RepID=UPI003AFF89E8